MVKNRRNQIEEEKHQNEDGKETVSPREPRHMIKRILLKSLNKCSDYPSIIITIWKISSFLSIFYDLSVYFIVTKNIVRVKVKKINYLSRFSKEHCFLVLPHGDDN